MQCFEFCWQSIVEFDIVQQSLVVLNISGTQTTFPHSKFLYACEDRDVVVGFEGSEASVFIKSVFDGTPDSQQRCSPPLSPHHDAKPGFTVASYAPPPAPPLILSGKTDDGPTLNSNAGVFVPVISSGYVRKKIKTLVVMTGRTAPLSRSHDLPGDIMCFHIMLICSGASGSRIHLSSSVSGHMIDKHWRASSVSGRTRLMSDAPAAIWLRTVYFLLLPVGTFS